MIGATGSVRGKKEFEPNSLAPESEPLLGPHLEDYWSIEDYWARSGGLLGWLAPSTSGGVFPLVSPNHGRQREGGWEKISMMYLVSGSWKVWDVRYVGKGLSVSAS